MYQECFGTKLLAYYKSNAVTVGYKWIFIVDALNRLAGKGWGSKYTVNLLILQEKNRA